MRSSIQPRVHPDALRLAALLRPAWADQLRALRASGVPLNAEGDPPSTVPIDQLVREREKARTADEARKAAETAASDLQKRVDDLESRDKTDVERLTKQVEKLTGDVTAEKARAEQAEADRKSDARASLIASAAREANFRDDGSASALIAAKLGRDVLDSIDDSAAAQRAVKDLVKSTTQDGTSWLVAPSAPAPVGVEKVLVNGVEVDKTTAHDPSTAPTPLTESELAMADLRAGHAPATTT